MVNAEVYKQFIKDIELEDICIVDATFQRKWQDLQLPESTSVQVNFEPKWQLNKQFLLIRTLFKVTASSEEINDTAPKKPIDIFEISLQCSWYIHILGKN